MIGIYDDTMTSNDTTRTISPFGSRRIVYGCLIAAVAFPTVVVLDALGQLEFPPWLAPTSAFVIVFYFTYGDFQLYDRFIADA